MLVVAMIGMLAVAAASFIGGLVGAGTWSSAAMGLAVLTVIVAQVALIDRDGRRNWPCLNGAVDRSLMLGAVAVASCVVWAVNDADDTFSVVIAVLMVVAVMLGMTGVVITQLRSQRLASNH